jgi:hypothetical protein
MPLSTLLGQGSADSGYLEWPHGCPPLSVLLPLALYAVL